MVLGVALVRLQQVVVDVLDTDLGTDPVQAEGVELLHHQGAGGVLSEGLVDPQSDLAARLHLPVDEMVGDEPVRQRAVGAGHNAQAARSNGERQADAHGRRTGRGPIHNGREERPPKRKKARSGVTDLALL